ncbi:hypothetical protein LINPERPRIM_LOCUS28769 [Linum perenne]
MKRSLEADSVSESKRVKLLDDEPATDLSDSGSGFMNLDENLLYEVLKHADLRLTSAAATSSLDQICGPGPRREAEPPRLLPLFPVSG